MRGIKRMKQKMVEFIFLSLSLFSSCFCSVVNVRISSTRGRDEKDGFQKIRQNTQREEEKCEGRG